MRNLFLIGGGGHCRSCIDVIEQESKYSIKGIFDVKDNIGKKILGYEILGTDADIVNYIKDDSFFLITVGQIKSADLRIKLFEKLISLKANLATIISPRAYVSSHAKINDGTIVLHDVLVNANAEVGVNCILNNKSLIEHDSIIGNHCHVSTGAIVNGGCQIENECFIGSNSVLKEAIVVKARTIVPAGSFYRGK